MAQGFRVSRFPPTVTTPERTYGKKMVELRVAKLFIASQSVSLIKAAAAVVVACLFCEGSDTQNSSPNEQIKHEYLANHFMRARCTEDFLHLQSEPRGANQRLATSGERKTIRYWRSDSIIKV